MPLPPTGEVQGLWRHWTQGIKHQMPHKTLSTTLVPVALGSRRLKENVEPGSQRDPRHQARLLDQAEREKTERRR